MAILDRTFTWWNGATWGTWLHTRLRGKEVGRDDSGNLYYQDKKNPQRRWKASLGDLKSGETIVVSGSMDSSDLEVERK